MARKPIGKKQDKKPTKTARVASKVASLSVADSEKTVPAQGKRKKPAMAVEDSALMSMRPADEIVETPIESAIAAVEGSPVAENEVIAPAASKKRGRPAGTAKSAKPAVTEETDKLTESVNALDPAKADPAKKGTASAKAEKPVKSKAETVKPKKPIKKEDKTTESENIATLAVPVMLSEELRSKLASGGFVLKYWDVKTSLFVKYDFSGDVAVSTTAINLTRANSDFTYWVGADAKLSLPQDVSQWFEMKDAMLEAVSQLFNITGKGGEIYSLREACWDAEGTDAMDVYPAFAPELAMDEPRFILSFETA